MFDTLLLAAAAFCAGVLNTVAGGGTFLTFPALVYTGVPVVAANATKFGRKAAFPVCPLSRIDVLVCDREPEAELAKSLRGAGVEIR